MALAYAVSNALSALAAGAFTFAAGPADATRLFLTDRRMDKRYATTSNSGGNTLVIDMGSAVSLVGFAVLNSDIAGAGGTPTLRVRAADDSGITTNVITPKSATTLNTSAPRERDHVLQFAATATKRYWEIAWVWTGSYQLHIGEIYALTASTQLSRVGIYGSGGGEHYKSVQSQMQYGETRGYFMAGPLRSLTLKWQDWTPSQLNELLAMWRATKGLVTPFIFIPSYEATNTAAAVDQQEVLFGRMMGPGNDFDWTQPDFNLFQPPDVQILSAGRQAGG